MLNLVPLLIGAGTVGIAHMAAPDHWVTLSIMGRTKKWAHSKVFKTSLVTAVGHVGLSLALGIAVAAVGIVFSHLISGYLDMGIGIVMIIIGAFVGVRPVVSTKSKGHKHEQQARKHIFKQGDHGHDGDRQEPVAGKRIADNAGYFAVLGAALSPDPSIIPIFLASIPAGFYFLIEIAIIFAATSILTLILLVRLGNMGLARALERIPEKYNDSIVGFVIAAIGVFILVAGH
jgi:nickel/cobalt exporter